MPHQPGQITADTPPVAVRVNRRAKHLRLRVHPVPPQLRLTVPPGTPKGVIDAFIDRHRGWAQRQLSRLPSRTPFADGAEIPLRGVPHIVNATGRTRGHVEVVGRTIRLPGSPPHLARRMRAFLQQEAKADIAAGLSEKTAASGLRPAGFSLRDPHSRWGSCSSSGRLSFSWRLIMAPPMVLDYVVAHEVAHLRHHDHSPAFWRLCEQLADDRKGAEAWLKRHGAALHLYGEAA